MFRTIMLGACAIAITLTPSAFADKAATPESRGKAILQAQLGAIKNGSDAAPMDATCAKSAAILPARCTRRPLVTA
ncbi:MAG: hypothetical protein JWO36_4629 [Myxococcales bacterium]|nr:hypothetical protein [Myxococcales bacterium]